MRALRIVVFMVASALLAGAAFAAENSAGAKPDAKAAGADYAASSRQTGNLLPAGGPLEPTGDVLKYGKWMFQGLCVRCHGIKGDGNGADWTLTRHDPVHWLPRRPRDFTDPVFKLRSTPSGSMPTDADLFESISRGLLAEKDMPSFKFLSERDRWALIAYVKSLSNRWTEEPPGEVVEIGEPPLPDERMVEAGRDVYARMQCAKCHGKLGKGDGPSADELKDDDRLKIIPRDFTNPAEFVGPADPRGIYRTFTTGLDGTPMPSFADNLKGDERWQLVWYVMSLRPGWNVEQARRELNGNAAAAVKSTRRGQ